MIKEIQKLWLSLPHRMVFLALFVAWALLFHFLGNSTMGYVSTHSVFLWLNALYHRESPNESGDELCPFIPFLVLALFYLKRAELTAIEKKPWAPALLAVVLGLLLHAVGFIIQQTRLAAVGFVVGGFGLMGILWGFQWLRMVAFPWFFLVAAIPISSYLDTVTFGLRLISSWMSVGICRSLFALDLVRQQTVVSLAASGKSAGFRFEVAAACSGMRSLTAVLLIGFLFAYLNYRSLWRRCVIIAASVPIALAGNVLRLCTVFVVGDAFGESAGKYIETRMGFITWIAALAGLFQVGRLIREPLPTAQPAGSQPPSDPPPLVEGVLQPAFFAGALPAWLPGFALGMMAASVGLILRVSHHQHLGEPNVRLENVPLFSDSGRTARTNSVHLPLAVAGYKTQTIAVTDLEFDYLPQDTSYGRLAYLSDDGSFAALANVVLMGTDRTSIHRPEYCLTSQGWDIRRQTYETIRLPGPSEAPMEVRRLDALRSIEGPDKLPIQRAGVYVFWFVADGEWTARHTIRQWSMIQSLLLENIVQRWAYISFFAECAPGEEEACYRKLSELIAATTPRILRQIPQAGLVSAGN